MGSPDGERERERRAYVVGVGQLREPVDAGRHGGQRGSAAAALVEVNGKTIMSQAVERVKSARPGEKKREGMARYGALGWDPHRSDHTPRGVIGAPIQPRPRPEACITARWVSSNEAGRGPCMARMGQMDAGARRQSTATGHLEHSLSNLLARIAALGTEPANAAT